MIGGDRDAVVEDDQHFVLFGPDGEDDHDYHGALTRSERRRLEREEDRHRRGHGRHWIALVAVVAVVLVGLAVGWFVARPMYNARYHPKDYAGAGTGRVLIRVNEGDDAGAIGKTLVHDGVVASKRAFTNQAAKNPKSQLIQPGVYALRSHMSAAAALTQLMTPAARLTTQVMIPEGATAAQIMPRMAAALHVPVAKVRAAMDDVSALGLPSTYTVGKAAPGTVEGFLYPATYSFDPGTAPGDAVGQLIDRFIEQDRGDGFAAAAPKLGVTPYQELIIASIAQSEAKYPADMSRVARVILNRLAARRPLQIDATSVYGAALKGLSPHKVNYATLDSPYNSYVHLGLPPTPISNPGASALAATAHAAAGRWLYYVNADASGHLFFTSDPKAFATAQLTCYRHGWGCAKP